MSSCTVEIRASKTCPGSVDMDRLIAAANSATDIVVVGAPPVETERPIPTLSG